MKLGKLMIFVSGLEKVKEFYCNILGFPLKYENGGGLEFNHEGYDFPPSKVKRIQR